MIPLNDEEIGDCVRRLADILDRANELQRQADSIKTILRATGPHNRRRYGDVVLTVAPNRRFDAGKARNVLSPNDYERVCVLRPDPATAREALDPTTYAACCAEGEMIVRLS